MKDDLAATAKNASWYDILEARSVRLQNRLSPVLPAMTFMPNERVASILTAIDHFKADGDLSATHAHDYFQLSRLSRWHIEGDAINRALAMVIKAQSALPIALREIGRVERTLFIIEWLLDSDMQRRAQIGLNKGESHHALKNTLRIGRQGEIRHRTSEGQHYRMAGLNLPAAIIIHWNTDQHGKAATLRKREGLNCSPELPDTSHPSDGLISSSQANIDGQNVEQTA